MKILVLKISLSAIAFVLPVSLFFRVSVFASAYTGLTYSSEIRNFESGETDMIRENEGFWVIGVVDNRSVQELTTDTETSCSITLTHSGANSNFNILDTTNVTPAVWLNTFDLNTSEGSSVYETYSSSGTYPTQTYSFVNDAYNIPTYYQMQYWFYLTPSNQVKAGDTITIEEFICSYKGAGAEPYNILLLSGVEIPVLQKLSPMFRFYNSNLNTHFYTASPSERDKVIDKMSAFGYEGISYNVFQKPSAVLTSVKPVYRFYNSSKGAHLYTVSEPEKTKIINNLKQYSYEGVAFYVFNKPYIINSDGFDVDVSKPVYRFYNEKTGFHFYTVSEPEKTKVINNFPQFIYEGVAYYVPAW